MSVTGHPLYCITCLHKLLALIFCLVIGVIIIYHVSRISRQQAPHTAPSRLRKPSQYDHPTKSKELSKSVIILSFLPIIFYCISLTALLIADIAIDDVYWLGAPYAVTSISWAAGNTFVYFAFMQRQKVVFRNTAYASRPSTYLAISIFVFMYFNCEVTYFILEVINVINPSVISDEQKFQIEVVVSFIEVFADILVSVSITTMFVKKLMAVALATFDKDDLLKTHTRSILDKQSFSGDIEVNSMQYALLNIITKQTILAAIGTISTQIWLVYYVPLVLIWSYKHDETHQQLYALHVVSEFMVVMDCCINSLCLLLAFAFVEDHYHKMCGVCHQCCLDKCVHVTKKKVATELIKYETSAISYHRLDD